jgi:RNA polymerase sigma factor for flagellar operon FliA
MQSTLDNSTTKKSKKAPLQSEILRDGALDDSREEAVDAAPVRTIEERDALIRDHMNYATSVASKIARSLSRDIDIDDVISNGRLGLLEAAKRYDAKFGVDFKTSAYYRIKGAIFDGLRKTGWIPRSLYSKIKFEQAANEYLQNNPGLADQKSEFLRKELAGLGSSVNSLASVYVMSLDSVDDLELEDHQASKDIEYRAEFQKIREKVCDAIESLPDKERKLIKMYYFQNKTMEEIGEQLSLSKSWTSRLHVRGLELLYKKVTALGQTALN